MGAANGGKKMRFCSPLLMRLFLAALNSAPPYLCGLSCVAGDCGSIYTR